MSQIICFQLITHIISIIQVKEKLKLDEAKTKLKGEGEDKPMRTNQMVRFTSYYTSFVFHISDSYYLTFLFREVDAVEPSFISFGVEYNGCQLNHYQRMKIAVRVKRRKKKTTVRVSVKHLSYFFFYPIIQYSYLHCSLH